MRLASGHCGARDAQIQFKLTPPPNNVLNSPLQRKFWISVSQGLDDEPVLTMFIEDALLQELRSAVEVLVEHPIRKCLEYVAIGSMK
jgi:hypothetical protein